MIGRLEKIIRITARLLGLIALGLGIWFIITKGLNVSNQGDNEIVMINLMIVFLAFGYIFALFREREGGIILTFGSIIMYFYFAYLPAEMHGQTWLYSLAFLVPGIMFLYLSMRKKTQDSEE